MANHRSTPPLQPPPRLEPRRPPALDHRSDSKTARLVTAGLVLGLGVIAGGVFLLLPDWVAARAETEVASATESPSIAEPTGVEVDAPDPAPESPASPVVVEDTATRRSEPETPASRGPDPARIEPPESVTPSPPDEPPAEASSRPSTPAPSVSTVDGDAFVRAMSDGLSALESGDAVTAKTAFEEAIRLDPDSEPAADGLVEAEHRLRLTALDGLRTTAGAAEASEQWAAAHRDYQAALAIDPTIAFAREGEARSGARAELDHRLDGYLAHPDRLSSDDVLREAERWLERARAVDSPGPRLQGQIRRLQATLDRAATPVTVTLVSDELTHVTIYRVGRLGAFSHRSLDLRPGRYVVVGQRDGFRDVRRELVVAPESAAPSLEIRCEEAI